MRREGGPPLAAMTAPERWALEAWGRSGRGLGPARRAAQEHGWR
jgi:hypothetical protein